MVFHELGSDTGSKYRSGIIYIGHRNGHDLRSGIAAITGYHLNHIGVVTVTVSRILKIRSCFKADGPGSDVKKCFIVGVAQAIGDCICISSHSRINRTGLILNETGRDTGSKYGGRDIVYQDVKVLGGLRSIAVLNLKADIVVAGLF